MKKRIKINGFIIFLAWLFIAVFPIHFFRPDKIVISDEIMEVFGIAFILLGQILRVSARGYKSEFSKNGNILVQGGPYEMIRNPMYLGIILVGIGISLVLFQWWVVALFLSVFLIRYLFLILKEEKKLEVSFGKEFVSYKSRVPRILPSLDFLFSRDVSEYLPMKLSWLKKEIGSISGVLLIVLLIESWEDIKSEGIKLYFREAIGILVVICLFVCLAAYLSKRTKNL